MLDRLLEGLAQRERLVPPSPAYGRVLLMCASTVVIVAGLRAADEILLPMLFSAFLAVLCQPMVAGLVRRRVPRVIAVLLVVTLLAAALLALTALLGDSVRRFTDAAPRYRQPLIELLTNALDRVRAWGVPTPPLELSRMEDLPLVDPGVVMQLVGQTLGAVLTVLSRLAIVLFTTAFLLLESVELDLKIRAALGADSAMATTMTKGAGTVQRYLAIKTVASLVTGLVLGALNMALGLDFAVLWGVVAFLFNYIPSIGSIIAAVPPVTLALVQLGPLPALGIAMGYLAVNLAIGNVAEPRIMGRRLGLSPLVVIVSLFFWGWVWGPAGTLVAVPMTVVAKLLLEVNPDTRWLAILLGSGAEAERVLEQRTRSLSPDWNKPDTDG